MAAKKLEYICVHTLDTQYNREIQKADIELWHLGALKNTNGTYTFLGKTYNANDLAKQTLRLSNGTLIAANKTNGRGWTKVGYSDFIQRSGNIVNLIPWNTDNTVDEWEITNGATGLNSITRHISLAGGWSKDGLNKTNQINGVYQKPEVVYTKEQLDSLIKYLKGWIQVIPTIKIIGHNQTSTKTCPNFWVPDFLIANNFPSENINLHKKVL